MGQTVALSVDLPVSTIAQVGHTLACNVRVQNKRPGSDDLAEVAVHIPGLVELCPAFGQRRRELVLGHNGQGGDQSKEEPGRPLGRELNAPVVQLPITDRSPIDHQRIPQTGLHAVGEDCIKREEDVVDGQRAPVRPLYPLPQREGPGTAVSAHGPRVRQRWLQFTGGIVLLEKSVEYRPQDICRGRLLRHNWVEGAWIAELSYD